jgi:hypothetical protein
LFYNLKRLFKDIGYINTEKAIYNIVDPTWPFLPLPSELQMDSTFNKIQGYLGLIIASIEAWYPVFSSDK